MNEFMKFIKYGCALLALIYFVYVFLPPHLIVAQHSNLEVLPEWLNRTISFVYFLLYGAIFYGLQKRKPIYWRLIPVLVGTLFLSETIGVLWTSDRLSMPLFLFFFIPIIMLIMFLVFIAWWRNQKGYFSATPKSDY